MTTPVNPVAIRRDLGRTGWKISPVSFGAWAIGGGWGTVSDADAIGALDRAIDLGVNFIDTADVYGDGRSERLIAQISSPVRWTETMYALQDMGVDMMVEAGPGCVLKGLARRMETLSAIAVDDGGIDAVLEEVGT